MKKLSLLSGLALCALLCAPACGGSDGDDGTHVHSASALADNLQNGTDAIIDEGVSIDVDRPVVINDGATLVINGKLNLGEGHGIDVNNGGAIVIDGKGELTIHGHIQLNGGSNGAGDFHIGADAKVYANQGTQIDVNCGRLYVDGLLDNWPDLKINSVGCHPADGQPVNFIEVFGTVKANNVTLNDGTLSVIGFVESSTLTMNGNGAIYVGLPADKDPGAIYYNANQTLPSNEYNLTVSSSMLNSGYIHNYDGWFVSLGESTLNGGIHLRNENKNDGTFVIAPCHKNGGNLEEGSDIGVVECRQ